MNLVQEKPAPKMSESVNELTTALVSLFNTGSYSDLTITCEHDRYSVHRAIICPRSRFFTVACTPPFKEAGTGVIDLPDDDPLAVKMMIMYFYHLDYNPHPESSDPSANESTIEQEKVIEFDPFSQAWNKKRKHSTQMKASRSQVPKTPPCLSLHAKMYAMGEKYDIAGLKKLALEKFQQEIQYHWNSDDFPLAIQEVYTSTLEHDRPLRDEIVRCMTSHPALIDKQEVQDLVKGLDLSFELLIHLRKLSRW